MSLMKIQASDVAYRCIATALLCMAKNDHIHQATLANDRKLTMLAI